MLQYLCLSILETDAIRDLESYRKLRDAGKPAKEMLVGRYLAEVVADCSTDNQRAAELVLYLLTDENNTRPLKTRAELGEDMGEETTKLDFVLEILVRLGLVMLLPEVPADRYQLVHDYLAPYIRQQQGTTLLEELQTERAQRKLSETKLSSIEKANQLLTEAQQQSRREPMRQKRGWILLQTLTTAIATAGCVLALRSLGLLQSLELSALDQLLRLRPFESADSRIVLVTVDESDIRQLGQWPMSDAVLARVINSLKQQQPRVIGLDLFRDLPVEPGHQALVNVFTTTPNLIGIEKVIATNDGEVIHAPPLLKQRHQVGASDWMVDTDNRVRRGLLYLRTQDNQSIFTLGASLAFLYLDKEGIDRQPLNSEQTQFRMGRAIFTPLQSNYGGYVSVDTGGYQILPNFPKFQKGFRNVSLTDILQGRLPKDFARDRIVFIGLTAESVNDKFFTSYTNDYNTALAGVELHALLASQLLRAVLDGHPLAINTCSEPIEWLWILSWSLAGTIVSWRILSIRWFLLNALFLTTILVAICYLAILQSWWLPLVPPFIAMIGVVLIALAMAKNKLDRLEGLRTQHTLDLLLKAYPEDPVTSCLAIEFLIRLTDSKEISTRLSQFLSEQDQP